ncbi:MAG: cysteine--tRNA ligase [Firmicutes bacterium]|nr:cysteine--tRNA ligase [Alicyclobacillaceae bacterium]MCL6497939.1 cysteine--tRNA ligase [Bacillota bacterium]
MAIQVFNTLTQTKEPLVPLVEGQVSIYVCGVTPYDHAHIGHARPAVVWDAIKRHLRRRGYVVRHVQNFTDIDDKLIRRARERGESVRDVAEQYMAEYQWAMGALGVLPPDFMPRVTDNLPAILEFVSGLVDRGYAYARDGDVYFRVAKMPDYGKLSGRSREALRAGARVEPEENKDDPQDFALWKRAPEDQPGWDSPWGRGRPGWHIECSAMSSRYLGPRFDLHGGGIDLIFPHHENEIAQSEAYWGHPSARIWVHNGLVTLSQVKMSKSLGNGVELRELLSRTDPRVLRTYLLSVHYRSPLEFSEEGLRDWGHGLQRLRSLWEEVRALGPTSVFGDRAWLEELWGFERRFLAALDDDFNTARAFAECYELVRDARRVRSAGGPGAAVAGYLAKLGLAAADEILGFLDPEKVPASTAEPAEGGVPRWVEMLLAVRQQARQSGQYAWADQVREVLWEAGWGVEDGREESRAVPRAGRKTGTNAP